MRAKVITRQAKVTVDFEDERCKVKEFYDDTFSPSNAAKIVRELLRPFISFTNKLGFFVSSRFLTETLSMFEWDDADFIFHFPDKDDRNNIYKVLFENKIYAMQFFDNPISFTNKNFPANSSYLYCKLQELDEYGVSRGIEFSFDTESMELKRVYNVSQTIHDIGTFSTKVEEKEIKQCDFTFEEDDKIKENNKKCFNVIKRLFEGLELKSVLYNL